MKKITTIISSFVLLVYGILGAHYSAMAHDSFAWLLGGLFIVAIAVATINTNNLL